MNDKPMETLLKSSKTESADRWYPVSIDTFRKGFALDSSVYGYHPLVDNLAYNLQYIQFLGKEIDELALNSVLYNMLFKMLFKNYVITGMSIVEGILSHIIRSNGWDVTDEEEWFSSEATQPGPDGVGNITISIQVKRHGAKRHKRMTLDQMIKCLDRHHRGLDVDHLIYPALKRLRELRNRVHLEKEASATNDHDYNAFDIRAKEEMRRVLYEVLSSERVTWPSYLSNYDFLK